LQRVCEALLRKAGDIGLPAFRGIELLAEAMEWLPEESAWDDEPFLRALENAADDRALALWQALIGGFHRRSSAGDFPP
jgi:hypothetical protein